VRVERWQRIIAVIGPGLIVGLVGGTTYWSVQVLAARNHRVNLTREVSARFGDLVTVVSTAAAGQRGYLLTGDTSHLALFRDAEARARGDLDTLAALTRDNPDQQDRIRRASSFVTARFDEMEQAIALRRSDGLAGVMPLLRSGRGERLMVAIRDIVAAARGEEVAILAEREAARQRQQRRTLIVVIGGTVGAVILALLTNAALVGLIRRRDAAVAALEAKSRELEEQAALLAANARELERTTAELQSVNRRLHATGEELERSNAQLQQSTREAEAANRAKSDFLATMSHELRTPLNAIGGYVELLSMELYGSITEQQRDALVRIHRSHQHLLRMINDVLNFARLEAGRVEVHVADVPLDETLADVGMLIEPQARNKQLRYEHRRCSPTVTVRADAEKLQQVVINLLSNAVKFTPAGGEIVLSTEVGEREVAVMVRDTGRGIAPDKLEAIFEPFVQLDTGLRRGAEGAGLGLAISRDLARRMEGDLVAVRHDGNGAWFKLTLWRGADRAAGVEPPRGELVSGSESAPPVSSG
jgi:signal transduction histidine kinase